MKKIIIISVSIVCVVFIGLAIAGGLGGGGWHRTPEEKIAYVKSELADKLDLTEEQMAALDRIGDAILAEREQAGESHKAFKASFLDLLQKDNLTAEELRALFDTKQPTIDHWMQFAANHIAEFHSMLTPEQRSLLIAEIESHQGHRCGFRH